jgi:hypothetical protein
MMTAKLKPEGKGKFCAESFLFVVIASGLTRCSQAGGDDLRSARFGIDISLILLTPIPNEEPP